jgi:hypothetical protein
MTQLLIETKQYQYNKRPIVKKKAATPIKKTAFPSDLRNSLNEEINEVYTIKYFSIKNEKFIVTKELFVKEFVLTDHIKQRKKNKTVLDGHISKVSNQRRKVGALAMSIHFPTPFLLFYRELEESFKESLLLKIGFTGVFGTILSLTGFSNTQLISGLTLLIVLAVVDAILGIIPNNLKRKNSNDHSLQAKAWLFVTNLLAIVGILAVHMFIKNLIPDPTGIQHIPANIHYFGIMFIISPYFHRIIKYVATANRTKIPKFISTMFKK